MNPLMKNKNFLRAAMENADMPTSPSRKGEVISIGSPASLPAQSLDFLATRVREQMARVQQMEEAERQLKAARDELRKCQDEFLDALNAAGLGIADWAHE